MNHFPRGSRLACLFGSLAFVVRAFAQTVAYTYVLNASNNEPQNGYGNSVTFYDTATSGRLTKVGTYPLHATSTLIGGNGSFLFAAGEDDLPSDPGYTNIDSYPIESNGALGARRETIHTGDYAGTSCTDMNILSAILDHSGHYMFVRISNVQNGSCDQWQTYSIASNGALTYLGREDTMAPGYLQTIDGSNALAYAGTEGWRSECNTKFLAYSRTSDHVLTTDHSFTSSGPASAPSCTSVMWTSADPTSHLAALMCCDSSSGLDKIASYTINSTTGAISSSNTWSEMPGTLVDTQVPVNSQSPMFMEMSPSGKLLAVAGDGFQIFHFDGASPVTRFTGLQRGTDQIRQTAWDTSNHFYTLDFWTGQLRVFTVTPTSLSEDPGSPVNANGAGVVVVSK